MLFRHAMTLMNIKMMPEGAKNLWNTRRDEKKASVETSTTHT
jgi:hypothetical protein